MGATSRIRRWGGSLFVNLKFSVVGDASQNVGARGIVHLAHNNESKSLDSNDNISFHCAKRSLHKNKIWSVRRTLGAQTMRRKVPSTTVLTGFEAAARHASFTEAAQELSLTQSAICRQIASLEEFLGVKLFRRGRQGVRLTDAGYNYHRLVAQRLNEIERDTLSVMGNHGMENALELAVVPTFGSRWLIPRLRK